MMDMNKAKEMAWELGQKLGELAEDAYKQGYSNGIKDGNINDGTFSEKVNEAYNNGLNDAWEAARKVASFTEREYCKIFERDFKNGVLGRIVPTEAIQKLRESEKQNADTVINIQMGEQSDKVDCDNTDCKNCINHNDCDYEDQTPRQAGEIKVGDEVNAGVGLKGIVTKIPKMVTDSFYYIMWDDGSCGHRNKDFIEQYKTGRTFPQIAELLKQMEEW